MGQDGKPKGGGGDKAKGPKKPGLLHRLLGWLIIATVAIFTFTALSFKSYSGIWPWDDFPRYRDHLQVTFEGLKIRSEGSESLKAEAQDVKKYGELLQRGAEVFEDGQEEFEDQEFEDAQEEFEDALAIFKEAAALIPEGKVAKAFVLKTEFMIRQCKDKSSEE